MLVDLLGADTACMGSLTKMNVIVQLLCCLQML